MNKSIVFGFLCLLALSASSLSAGADVAKAAPPHAPSALALDSLTLADGFGVNAISATSLVSGGAKVYAGGARLALYGVEWRALATDTTYTPPSNYNWNSSDTALLAASQAGLSSLIVLGGNPCWAATFERGVINKVPLSRWVDYVNAVVQRYSVAPYNVHYYEIYNEPDAVSFTMSTPDCTGATTGVAFGDHPTDYVQTLQLASQAIKAADPNATIFMGGIAYDLFTCGPGCGLFVQSFLPNILALGAGNYFDVMNFHYYSNYDAYWQAQTGLPGILGKISALRSVLASSGVTKPFICSELGASSVMNGATPDSQSIAVVMDYARGFAGGIKIGIWYNIADYISAGDYFQYNGLLDVNYVPKPSYTAYGMMRSSLIGKSYTRALNAYEFGASQLEGYVFRDSTATQELIILWTSDGSSQTVTLPAGVTAVKDKYTNPVSYSSTLAVSGDPRFIFRTVTSQVSDLTVSKNHSGNFMQGQANANYTINVSNVGTWTTLATVYMTDTLPSGLSATGLTGSGWTCSVGTVSCYRSDTLPKANSFPAVTLTVNVASNAPANRTNSVQVAGGGELNLSNDTANDPTTITPYTFIPKFLFIPMVKK